MGTNKTRNSVPSSTTKDRLNFTVDCITWDEANETWDESGTKTWDDCTPQATGLSTLKSRNSIPSSSNKSRN